MSFRIANVENPSKPENSVCFPLWKWRITKATYVCVWNVFVDKWKNSAKLHGKGKKLLCFCLVTTSFCVPCMAYQELQENFLAYGIHIPQMKFSILNLSEGMLANIGHWIPWTGILASFVNWKRQQKKANNVIDEPFFQVCIPGLHLTLRIYMKMFTIFENFCRELDGMIGAFVAGNGGRRWWWNIPS